MNESIYSALTVDDEKRQIGTLICGLVQRVDYGRDFEKQLSFYAEARAAFPNLDSVHVQLVQVSISRSKKLHPKTALKLLIFFF